MHKLLAIAKAFVDGGITIDYVDKTRVLKTPGDVTELNHN